MNRSKFGFTLIELLIVVAIIAILAAIAVPNFLEAQVRAKVSRCKADMRTTLTALEAYAVVNNTYPPMGDMGTPNPNVAAQGFHSRVPNYLTTPIAFMTSITLDPFVNQKSTWWDTVYPIQTQVGKRYVYYNTVLLTTVVYTDVWGGLVNWVGAHLIYGYGPDQDPFNHPNQGNDTLMPYDSTNGTISFGNVIRCQKMTDGVPVHPTTGTYIWP